MKPKNDSEFLQTFDGLYREMHAVVSRWALESDCSVFMCIAAMEAVKSDLLDELKKYNKGEG